MWVQVGSEVGGVGCLGIQGELLVKDGGSQWAFSGVAMALGERLLSHAAPFISSLP